MPLTVIPPTPMMKSRLFQIYRRNLTNSLKPSRNGHKRSEIWQPLSKMLQIICVIRLPKITSKRLFGMTRAVLHAIARGLLGGVNGVERRSI